MFKPHHTLRQVLVKLKDRVPVPEGRGGLQDPLQGLPQDVCRPNRMNVEQQNCSRAIHIAIIQN